MSGRSVVDTNVLVVANGRASHVGIRCQLRCVHELRRLAREGVVCVDDKWLIMREYLKRTGHKGPAEPGTAFYKQYLAEDARPKPGPVGPGRTP